MLGCHRPPYIDTNAAIVGEIVALATRADGIPADWRADREGVPDS
jgi:hypothetical protein